MIPKNVLKEYDIQRRTLTDELIQMLKDNSEIFVRFHKESRCGMSSPDMVGNLYGAL